MIIIGSSEVNSALIRASSGDALTVATPEPS
jgi:hypothetical protein